MDKQTGPKGFLVVLPGEIIEIPQDSDKSWLTLFYSLPRELAEKWKPAYELPRCPYEVLRTDKYDHIVCDDMFKLLVWDCYAWCAWQFFQVKDRKGNYRDIPGNWNQYAGYFPLWRLSYSIIPYIRMKFEQSGLGFQNLYNIPQGVEVPWLTYQQFSNLVGNVTDMVIAEQNWQPMIDAIWKNRTVEDYETTSSTVKTDFMRKWHHNRSGKPISLDEMMENEDGGIFEVADPRGEFEQKVISEMQIAAFAEQSITEKDREILKLRMDGLTEQEIADKTAEERYEERLKQAKPVLDAIFAWANSRTAAPKSALGKALNYLKEQWPYLTNYLKDGRLELSNNRAERSIKPFVIDRKNFLFANTPKGAAGSAVMFSLIQTTMENGLDPYRYLTWLMHTANHADLTDTQVVQSLLPWNAPAELYTK